MNGILMKPDMHQAIREGRKTVTRRILDKEIQPIKYLPNYNRVIDGKQYFMFAYPTKYGSDTPILVSPRYHVGESVYIKEAWRIINPIGKYLHNPYDFGIEYLSFNHEVKWWTDNGNIMTYPIDEKLRSPLFLPAKFARDFIKITDVRPERLKNIDEDEAIKEGFRTSPGMTQSGTIGLMAALACFVERWDTINPLNKWGTNPWVFRYEFQPITKPEAKQGD
jgi:hypothetical protein